MSISCRTVQSFSSTMLNGWASTLTYQPPRWIMIAKMIIILNFYSKSPQAMELVWNSADRVMFMISEKTWWFLSVINFVFKVHRCTLCENVYFHFHAMVQDILHTRVRTSGIVEVNPCDHFHQFLLTSTIRCSIPNRPGDPSHHIPNSVHL